MTLHARVADRCQRGGLPISPEAVREIERYLKEERRAEAYARAGVR